VAHRRNERQSHSVRETESGKEEKTGGDHAHVSAWGAGHLHGHGHLDGPRVVEPVPELVLRRLDVWVGVGRGHRRHAPL